MLRLFTRSRRPLEPGRSAGPGDSPDQKKQWYFGMKSHVSENVHSGLVYTVSVTPANVPNVKEFRNLLREDDRTVIDNKADVNKLFKLVGCKAGVGGQGDRSASASCGKQTIQSLDVFDSGE